MIHISTRQSPLALWQAEFVGKLYEQHLGEPYRLIPRTTEGDVRLSASLAWQGGKGLFLKELQQDLLNHQADIAVHSMKDVPVNGTPGLSIACILPRHSVEDALISNDGYGLNDLPNGAVIGTSSLRRQAQLLHQRADLQIKLLRGNIHTRLSKLDDGLYDAIVLAKAGLDRMQLEHRISQTLNIEEMLPAVSQGAIGIECRTDDKQLIDKLQHLNDPQTTLCVQAERFVNKYLGGHCHAPIGCLATLEQSNMHIVGRVISTDGKHQCQAHFNGPSDDWQSLAQQVAQKLIDQGALQWIENASNNH